MTSEVITWTYKSKPSTKKILYVFQGGKCNHCKWNYAEQELTIDHIKALADGGPNNILNKQLLCIDCHKKKTAVDNEIRLVVMVQNRQKE